MRTIYGFSAPWPSVAVPAPGPADAPRIGGRLRPVVDPVVQAPAVARAGGAGRVWWVALDQIARRQLRPVGWLMLVASGCMLAGLGRLWGVEAGLWPLWPAGSSMGTP